MAEVENCQVCFNALSSGDLIRCANNHSIHFSCYRKLQKKECIFKCETDYCFVSLQLSHSDIQKIDTAIDNPENKQKELNKKLLDAAKNKRWQLVKNALQEGAEVNARNNFNNTALLWAAYHNNLEIVRFLVERGADVNVVDNDGLNSIHNMFLNKDIKEPSLELLNYLLEQKLDIDAQINIGTTALHFALENGYDTIANILLDCGANPKLRRRANGTCIHYLHPSITKATLKRLLAAGVDINAQSNDGYSALHYACENNRQSVIRMLLSNGAAPRLLDNKGESPLSYLLTNEHKSEEDAEFIRFCIAQGM